MNSIPSDKISRLIREEKTIRAMIGIYCRGNHATGINGNICAVCQTLLDYAGGRIDRCPFGEKKPPCAKCSVHCYKPSLRDQIKAVMRYAGPRMLWRHPLMAIQHCFDGYLYQTSSSEGNKDRSGEADGKSDESRGDLHSVTDMNQRKNIP
jgi:hypothetical protein